MGRSARTAVLALGGVPLVVTVAGCSSAVPTGTPGVHRLGRTVLRYVGPEVETVLSYRAANLRQGAEWLLLDVAVTGTGRASVELKRERIAIRIPSGEVVPLVTQEEFGQAYPQLAAALARADVASEPLDYFMGRRSKGLTFIVAPGSGIAFNSVWVNDREVASGRLCFFISGGVQPGPYELRIDLRESKVRIPFRLGET